MLEANVTKHYKAITLPTMSTGATDMAYLRAKGIQCYGVGPATDIEDGPKGFGAHSDQERILESELHRFVRFHYDVVVDLAAQEIDQRNTKISEARTVALEILAAILLGAALAAAYAGPLRFEAFGTTISIRTLSRPLIAAAIVFAARIGLGGRPLATAALEALAKVTCGALITAGTIGWISYLSMTCGGADSYGYVSAGERLLAGAIVQNEPLAEILPANGVRAATPLGYVPAGRIPNASVPAYPLGLSAVMAIATTFFGRSGAFYVAPLCGLILLAASSVITRAWYGDRMTALLASALLAVNPLVFTYSIQAMSDVPAAAALMVAVAALSRTPSLPILAGIASRVGAGHEAGPRACGNSDCGAATDHDGAKSRIGRVVVSGARDGGRSHPGLDAVVSLR